MSSTDSGEEQAGGARRREFLGGAAGAAIALGAGPALAAAGTGGRRGGKAYFERSRVDLHAHVLPPFYLQALEDAGLVLLGGLPIPSWSAKQAREFMALHGIAFQMVSISDPSVMFLPADEQPGLARKCNDFLAALVRGDSSHFGAHGCIPMDDPAAAREEAIYCLDTLGLDGVGLFSSSKGVYLGDPAYDALLNQLNKRKAWVFVHPREIGEEDRPSYSIPPSLMEFPFDSTRALASLLFHNSFARFPGIRWQFTHGGGAITMMGPRLSALAANAAVFADFLGLPPESKVLDGDSPRKAFEKLVYDTTLVADGPGIAGIKQLAGVRHLIFGSDWPFSARTFSDDIQDPAPGLSDALTDRERRRVERLNARRFFPRIADIVPAEPKQ